MIDFLFIFLYGTTFLLSLLHFYWASGGNWGIDSAVPSKLDGQQLFEVGPLSCAVVGVVLMGLCWFYYFYISGWVGGSSCIHYPSIFTHENLPCLVILIIATGFLVRAMGDFKYVGFFKSVRNTKFGRLDSKYFSPLCFLLGIASLALYFLAH